MASIRPLVPDATASVPAQAGPRDDGGLTPAALQDVSRQEAGVAGVTELADRSATPSRLFRLPGRHPRPADRLTIETTVTRRSLAALLAAQGPGTVALHDIPGPDGEPVHHVLIGPTGVFVISALEVPGSMVLVLRDEVLVGGRRHDAFVRLQAQTAWVAERLGLAAEHITPRPVLLINGYRHLSVRERADVVVVSIRGLREWLGRRAPALDPATVTTLGERARDPRTWGLDATWTVSAPHPQALAEFDRLVRLVRRARRTRWALAFGAAVASFDLLIAGWTWWG